MRQRSTIATDFLKSRGISGRALAFVSVLFLMAITLAPPMQRYFAQKAQINALRSGLKDTQASLAAAEKQLAQWDDPTYVASQARQRLHFIFPGENQYIVIGSGEVVHTSDAPAAPVANSIPMGLPWYDRLVSSITNTNTHQ